MPSNTASLNKIVSILRDLSIRSKFINDFGFGQTSDLNAIPNIKYPILWVEPDTNITKQGNNFLYSEQHLGFNLYLLDRINKGDDNYLELLSDTQYNLSTIIAEISQHRFYIQNNISLIDDISYEPVQRENDDNVNGYLGRIKIKLPLRYTICNNPIEPITGFTISINSNITEYRLIGATGATGPQGATGATGPQGATGPAIDLKWYVEPSTPPTILPKLGPGVVQSIAIGDGAEANDTLMFVIGYRAGQFSGGVQGSNFIGVNTGYQSSNCSYSNFIGSEAGFLTTNAHESNFIGIGAGRISNGSRNSNFIGGQAGAFSNTATYANFIGFNVGRNFSTGSHNTFIGTNISLPNNTSRSLNIGGVLFGKNLYGTITGNPRTTPVTDGQIGIGVAPSEITNTLHIRATIDPLRIEGLQVTTNTDLLIMDPNGVVSKRTIDSIIPSLQGVTNVGNTTSNNIIIENSLFRAALGEPNPQNEYASLDIISKDYFNQYGGDVKLRLNPEELFSLSRNNSGWFGVSYDMIWFVNTNNKNNNLEFANVTDNRTYNFPDASGTIALQEWVTAQNYLGATPSLSDVCLVGNTTNGSILARDFTVNNQYTLRSGFQVGDSRSIIISNIGSTGSTFAETNTNTIIGINAFGNGFNSTNPLMSRGRENVAIGFAALSPTSQTGATSNFNVAIGAYALGSSPLGSNTAIGNSAGYGIKGSNNTAIGVNALLSVNELSTGNDNVAVGNRALAIHGTGNRNTAIGGFALEGSTGTTGLRINGNENVAIGWLAGRNNNNGSRSIFVGVSAGQLNSGGLSLRNSTDSIFIGANTRSLNIDSTNEIVIGANVIGRGDNTVTIGDSNITSTQLRGLISGATGYSTTGGLSTQFLKADGSLDSNTYLTNATLPTNLVRGSGITNSIAYWNSTTGITASSIFGITGSSVYIGIPESQFTFGANRSSFTTVWDGLSGSGLPVYRAVGYSNVNGDNPSFSGFRALGTINAPLVPTQDINLTTFAGLGWNGTGWTTGGQLTFRASETFGATAGGTWLILSLNRNGRIDNDRQWIFEPEVIRSNVDNLVTLGTSARQFNTVFTNNISFSNGVTVRQHTSSTNATLTTIGGDDLSTSLNVRLRNASNNNVALISNTGRFAFGRNALPDASLQGQVVGQMQIGDDALVGFEATLRLRNGSTDNFISMVRTGVRGWSIGINSSGVFQIVDRDATASRLNIDTTGRIGLLGSIPTHTLTLPSNTSGVVLYNTTDQTTNFERLRLINTSNTFTLVSEAGGTGTIRSLSIGVEAVNGSGISRVLRINSNTNADNSMFYFTNNFTSLAGSAVMIAGGFNGNLNRQNALTIATTISQTASGSINTGILVSPFYTSNSSTNNILIDLGTNTAANAGGTHSSVFQVLSNGKFIIPVGTNQPIGTATLVNGTVTINNTLVTANSSIIMSNVNPNASTQLGTLNVGSITPGVSFTVNSLRHSSPTNIETGDSSTFRFWILN